MNHFFNQTFLSNISVKIHENFYPENVESNLQKWIKIVLSILWFFILKLNIKKKNNNKDEFESKILPDETYE